MADKTIFAVMDGTHCDALIVAVYADHVKAKARARALLRRYKKAGRSYHAVWVEDHKVRQ